MNALVSVNRVAAPVYDEVVPALIPNLVVMGAQKSGTSSLHDALKQHPSVFMSTPLKEASYFLPEPQLAARLRHYNLNRATDHQSLLDNYMLNGYAGEPFFGESPTDYTLGERPRAYAVPARISRAQPDMRFLYIVRNPFERILSAQRHHIGRHGRDPIRQIIAGDSSQMAGLVKTSQYFYQLSAFLEYFDISRFHIVRFEDFVRNQVATMRGVFDFLGLEDELDLEPMHRNASKVETFESTQKLPRAFLDDVYPRIVDDMNAFADATGIDLSSWDLTFETWCADDEDEHVRRT